MVGRVLALQMVLIAGTTPIGAPILGAVSDAIGGRAPMYVGAIGAFAAAAVVIVAMRRHNPDHLDHDLPATSSGEGGPLWKH
jgi:predicted MFS family arabinose efflux permease